MKTSYGSPGDRKRTRPKRLKKHLMWRFVVAAKTHASDFGLIFVAVAAGAVGFYVADVDGVDSCAIGAVVGADFLV